MDDLENLCGGDLRGIRDPPQPDWNNGFTGCLGPKDPIRAAPAQLGVVYYSPRDPSAFSEGTTGPSWHLHNSVSLLTVPEKVRKRIPIALLLGQV